MQDVEVFGLAQVLDNPLFMRAERGKIDFSFADAQPHLRAQTGFPAEPGGMDQRLARNASPVDAGPAQHALFHHQHPRPPGLCPERRGKGGGTGAEDHYVMVVGHGSTPVISSKISLAASGRQATGTENLTLGLSRRVKGVVSFGVG